MEHFKNGQKRTEFSIQQDLDPKGAGQLFDAITLGIRKVIVEKVAKAAKLEDMEQVTIDYLMALSKNEPYDVGVMLMPVGKFFTAARTVKMDKREEEQFEIVRMALRKKY